MPSTASAAVIASFVIVQQLVSGDVGALLASGPPAWVWATLLMAGFAALTVLTMLLARIPTLRPPPDDADEEDGDAEPIQDDHGRADVDDAQRSLGGGGGGAS